MLLPFTAKGICVMIHVIVIIINFSTNYISPQSMLVVFIDVLKASYNLTLIFLILVDYHYQQYYYHCAIFKIQALNDVIVTEWNSGR